MHRCPRASTQVWQTQRNQRSVAYGTNQKAKSSKKCVIKRKLKSENYKSCLEATQIENKINYLEKNKINIDILKKIINN